MQHLGTRERLFRGAVKLLAAAVLVSQLTAAARSFQDAQPAESPSIPAVPLFQPLVQAPRAADPADRVSDLLIQAIVAVESNGDPTKVGRAGERGLMQIREGTWNEVTQQHLDLDWSFDLAFDPDANMKVGRAYLDRLHRFLGRHRDRWQANERDLLLACYNAGPERVRRAGFGLRDLPASTRSYVERAAALHDAYLTRQSPRLYRYVTAQLASR